MKPNPGVERQKEAETNSLIELSKLIRKVTVDSQKGTMDEFMNGLTSAVAAWHTDDVRETIAGIASDFAIEHEEIATTETIEAMVQFLLAYVGVTVEPADTVKTSSNKPSKYEEVIDDQV